MGNLLSVLIGCVGAVELFTLLNQITARAELEYERLRLAEMGQGALEESCETTIIIEKILTESQSAVPQIHFDAYERSTSVPDTAPVVDGLKCRPLVRDDGTGRRRAFRKRESSGSIDSTLAREEELRMLEQLEEEEFRAISEGYVPITYGSEPESLKMRRRGRRHRKSPISDSHRDDSVGTLSSSEVTEDTPIEESEEEVTYPWGDINPEHHKGFKQQMVKTLSIGELHEEDEKLGSSVESNKDWRNTEETVSLEADKGVKVTVSSVEMQSPAEILEEPPRSFACVDQAESVPDGDDNEAKVEEWLNHGHITDSYSPTGTLTRSKRYLQDLQMESMDVQDGDTSTPTDFTVDDTSVPANNHYSEEISEVSSIRLDGHLEGTNAGVLELQQSPSPEEISQEFLEDEDVDEERDEESLVSGEEEIEDFDDIVNALKKNVPKEEVKLDDLLEQSALDSQKSAIFTVSPEDEEDTEEDDEDDLSFPVKKIAAYNEFPLENMIPFGTNPTNNSDRCEILEQIRKENRRRNRNMGPDRYFAPRPSVIDFPVKLEIANKNMEEELKVFPLKNVNDDQFFPTKKVSVRKNYVKTNDNDIIPDITIQEPQSSENVQDVQEKPEEVQENYENLNDLKENRASPVNLSNIPSEASRSPSPCERISPASSANDELTKFLNTERLSISPARKSVERSESNLRIADRDDPLMDLLKDRMFPF